MTRKIGEQGRNAIRIDGGSRISAQCFIEVRLHERRDQSERGVSIVRICAGPQDDRFIQSAAETGVDTAQERTLANATWTRDEDQSGFFLFGDEFYLSKNLCEFEFSADEQTRLFFCVSGSQKKMPTRSCLNIEAPGQGSSRGRIDRKAAKIELTGRFGGCQGGSTDNAAPTHGMSGGDCESPGRGHTFETNLGSPNELVTL